MTGNHTIKVSNFHKMINAIVQSLSLAVPCIAGRVILSAERLAVCSLRAAVVSDASDNT